MPSSKARQLADLFGGSGDGGSIAPNLVSDLENTSTGAFDVPSGTTAERPSSPTVGYLRFNTTLDQLEQYTSEGWKGISAPPTITSIDVTNINTSLSEQTFVITGFNFDQNAVATLQDANGNILTATSSTRNSDTQITLLYSGSQYSAITVDTPEPLVVKVTNGSGLEAKLEGTVGVDDSPIWSSPSSNSTTQVVIGESASLTLSATDPETNGSVTFAVTSGTLPSGMTLSGNVISGTPTASESYTASGIVSPITVSATGADNDTTPRSFNIIRKWRDGSSADLAAPSAYYLRNVLGISTDGWYWLRGTGTTPFYTYNLLQAGGWTLWLKYKDIHSTPLYGYDMKDYNTQSYDPNGYQFNLTNGDAWLWTVPTALVGTSTSSMQPELYLGLSGDRNTSFPTSNAQFKYLVQAANSSGTGMNQSAEIWQWMVTDKLATTYWGMNNTPGSNIRYATGTNYRFGTNIGTIQFGHNQGSATEFETLNFRNQSGSGGASWSQSGDIWAKSGWGAIDATNIGGGDLAYGNGGGGWGSNGGFDANGSWTSSDMLYAWFQTPNLV